MRGARIIWVGAAAILAIVLAFFLFGGPIVGGLLRQALAAQGAENPQVKVQSVSLGRLRLADIRTGKDTAPDLRIDTFETTYDIGALLSRRTVKTLAIGPGSARIDSGKDGVSIGGMKFKGGGESRGLPFEAIKVEDFAFVYASPGGEARGRIDGALDLKTGGAFKASVASPKFSDFGVRFDRAKVAVEMEFEDAGRATASASFAGAATGFGIRADNVAFDLGADFSDWRKALAGDAQPGKGAVSLHLRSATVLSSPNSARSDARFAGVGRADFALEGGRLTVGAPETGLLRLVADRGDLFLMDAIDAAPVFVRDDKGSRMGIAASLAGGPNRGAGSLKATRADEAPWRYQAGADFSELGFAGVSFGPTKFSAAGAADGKTATANVDADALIRAAKVGRLNIADAALDARLRMDADLAKKSLAVASLAEDCLRMSRGRFGIEGQNTEIRLSSARLCRGDGPLLVAHWGDRRHADVQGLLNAASGSLRVGATRFDGLPPVIDLAADYDPEKQLTQVRGTLADGRVAINGGIIATRAAGTFAAQLDREALSAQAALTSVTLTQNAKPLMVAPVIASGTVRLAEERVAFDYAAKSQSGAAIGEGSGDHDVRAGIGDTHFRTRTLKFSRTLQPASLLPALKGIVGNATGTGEGEARFHWGKRPSDFRSSGRIKVADLRFIGPGRAVSQTVGVNGELELSSLAPLKSAGDQTMTVRLLDLDALMLENGVIHYELPGDQTLRVIDAEFPWFGGSIGAYDATASLAGAKVELALRAADVNLKQMLEFIDIEGLSGEGTVEGVLPLAVAEGKARIVDGTMSAKGPGVIRYTGKAAEAAAASNEQAKMAFDILRELHFDELTAKVAGPLDGDLQFNIVFKGANNVVVGERNVTAPVVYRISIEAPILALIDQARVSTDFRLQMDRSGEEPAQ